MTSGIDLNIKTGVAKGAFNNVALTDSFVGIEDARGTELNNRLSGDMGVNKLLGRGGDDFIYGDGIQANLTGAAAGQVYRMYQATLARVPDAGGY